MRREYSSDPRKPGYWPRRVPPRNAVKLALKLLDKGDTSSRDIERRTGLTPNRIVHIRAQPQAYDPVDDPVAIDRALAGDRSVLPALTIYERVELRARLVDRALAEPFDRVAQSHPVEGEQFWLTVLADRWGVSVSYLSHMVSAAKRRRQNASADDRTVRV